jgi:hypothetical protein
MIYTFLTLLKQEHKNFFSIIGSNPKQSCQQKMV